MGKTVDDVDYNDGLNENQMAKKVVIPEPVDEKGLVYRQHVLDSTSFDKLLLSKDITISQHLAAEFFISALEKSGVFLQSPSLEPSSSRVSGYEQSLKQSARTIAMSSVMSYLRDRYHDADITLLFKLAANETLNCKPHIFKIKDMLTSLEKYYGTNGIRDPRFV